MYPASATIIGNLMMQASPLKVYPELWQALYGDSYGNELYVIRDNRMFTGKSFALVATVRMMNSNQAIQILRIIPVVVSRIPMHSYSRQYHNERQI
jgi:hypothetical protein